MKIHLLGRESVTPIALYIARRDEEQESFERQVEFGTVLLYREREYRSMYSSDWLGGAAGAHHQSCESHRPRGL